MRHKRSMSGGCWRELPAHFAAVHSPADARISSAVHDGLIRHASRLDVYLTPHTVPEGENGPKVTVTPIHATLVAA